MKKLFVDTGAFLAKEIVADQHHRDAVMFWTQIADRGFRLYSTEHVLDETATFLGRRVHYAWAADWGGDVLAAGIEWLSALPDDYQEAFKLMRKFADQGVSYTDCVSFALMKRENIREVFAFDQHFSAAGFRVKPS